MLRDVMLQCCNIDVLGIKDKKDGNHSFPGI